MDNQNLFNDVLQSAQEAQQYAQRAQESFNPMDWQTAQAYMQQAQYRWDMVQNQMNELSPDQQQQLDSARGTLDEASRNIQQAALNSPFYS